jgi:hypothetical protein
MNLQVTANVSKCSASLRKAWRITAIEKRVTRTIFYIGNFKSRSIDPDVKEGIANNMISLLRRGGIAAAVCALSGCAVPLFAGITLNEVSTAGSVVSTLATGKGLGDHALDLATGDDCRFLEGLVRKDRNICETPGSPGTAGDFQGVSDLASAHPAADRPSLKEHSVGPIASTLADRDVDRPAKRKATQVAAIDSTPTSIPVPIPAPVGSISGWQTAPVAVPLAQAPASVGPAAPGTAAFAAVPKYY